MDNQNPGNIHFIIKNCDTNRVTSISYFHSIILLIIMEENRNKFYFLVYSLYFYNKFIIIRDDYHSPFQSSNTSHRRSLNC